MFIDEDIAKIIEEVHKKKQLKRKSPSPVLEQYNTSKKEVSSVKSLAAKRTRWDLMNVKLVGEFFSLLLTEGGTLPIFIIRSPQKIPPIKSQL